MASSNRIIAFCLCFIASVVLCVESQHRHGDELATLLAAGLVTALLKKGARGKNLSARHMGGILMQPPPHALRIQDMMHARGFQGLEFHGFGLPPAFGGVRYTVGPAMDTLPLAGLGLKALNGPTLGVDFGQFPPLPHALRGGDDASDRAQVRKSFDFVHGIIGRERSNQAPPEEDQTLNGPTLNEPTVTVNNRGPFGGYEQRDDRSRVHNQQPSTSQPYYP